MCAAFPLPPLWRTVGIPPWVRRSGAPWAGRRVPDFIYNIGTTVLNVGISMVIFFFVNKIIFPESKN